MKEYLQKLIDRVDLTRDEMGAAFDTIMNGDATPAQIGAFITALRMKGETPEEVAGAAGSMRAHAVAVDGGPGVVDTCGTGGDGAGTFNISTAAAFVTAGAGVPVAKHGNRAISSTCGSADVLTELGVNIELSPADMGRCIREVGIGFLFAPMLHPAMKHAMGPRRELGIRTVFNMLGPLTNPAGARAQVIGVFAPELTGMFANVLKLLGSERAIVAHGGDGLDEITTTTTTQLSELAGGTVQTHTFDPREFITDFASPADLAGGDAATNAAIVRDVLGGAPGPCADIVAINAGAAIYVGGAADSLAAGVAAARAAIAEGRAAKVLDALVAATQ